MSRCTVWMGSLALALGAAGAALPARAEVSAEIDASGAYARTVIQATSSTKNVRIWSKVNSRPSLYPLNVDGDLNGDLWPTVAEQTQGVLRPWVVWSRFAGAGFDLAWSRFDAPARAWTPIAWVEGAGTAGDDLDPPVAFPDALPAGLVLDAFHRHAERGQSPVLNARSARGRPPVLPPGGPAQRHVPLADARLLPDESVGLAAMISEFLVQSVDDTIRVFPCWPPDKDAHFANLRAQGGFLVSAEQQAGQITKLGITSTVGGKLRLLNPWTGQLVERETTAGERVIFNP